MFCSARETVKLLLTGDKSGDFVRLSPWIVTCVSTSTTRPIEMPEVPVASWRGDQAG